MTQRSIQAGAAPAIIIKAGGSLTIRGVEGERVSASTSDHWGLQVDKGKGSEKQIARARAAVGEHVLFDVRLKLPNWEDKNPPDELIEVQFGGSGEVQVPFGANLKVYAGRDITVEAIRGLVDVYAGASVVLRDVYCLGNASAGGAMDLDCETMLASGAEYKAGGDIRFRIRELASARIRVKDLGGYWEARIGEGERSVYLKCGGDATLVTDQKVEALPPNYVLGNVEPPKA